MKNLVAILAFGLGAYAQTVINPRDIPCSQETLHSNFGPRVKQHLSGTVKDATGAPFVASSVSLRRSDSKSKFIAYRTVTTDKNGHFDFGRVTPGKYRLLPAPNRGWKQPTKVICSDGGECILTLALELNPTDQRFAGCPTQ